jgi:hypothetical protein
MHSFIKVDDVNKEGNFLLGFKLKEVIEPRNVSIFVKHRCNKYNIVGFKVVNFVVQPAEKYPSRVWESVNTAIALDGNEQNFNQLRGKADL